jgi:hypothetical protein
MVSDVALRSIALNLAALRLDPLLHLKSPPQSSLR